VVALPLQDAQTAPADQAAILDACRRALPAYMLPSHVELRTEALPRNPNGKIDRKLLQQELAQRYTTSTTAT
jgi:acyl-CoA synthetase (AMP-forming)/AMP-acid ligase II